VQWVSTFASGAPSLGRPRRLAVHPAEFRSAKPPGENAARAPLICLGNIRKGKSEKEFSGFELPEAELRHGAISE
jgi:hypothetical protein